MLKNIQAKIVLIFVILLTIIVSSFGIIAFSSIQEIEASINKIEQAKQNIKISIAVSFTMIAIFSVILFYILSKYVIYPMNKLIKSAEEIENKNKNKSKIGRENKKKIIKDIGNVENLVDKMTSQLKARLDEVLTQKNQIETILLNMTDGIIAFNLDGEIILINPVAREYLNISPELTNFDSIFSRFDVQANLEKVIYLKDWTSTEQRISVDDKYLNIYFAPFKNEQEISAGAIAVIQNITSHVQLDIMQKEFIADVSHELKTPITSIMGYSETLLDGDCDKDTTQKFLNVISTEARRMARLVTDLLTLSRYDNQKKKTKKEHFNLGELVKNCQDKLGIEIKKKNQKVESFVTANVPLVYAEKDDIERVVLNILSNSIKYTEENGEIKMYVGFVHTDAYVKIIDNGIGIPEEDLCRIFERFYRVDKARTREMGGTGLGLAIAKEILDKNGGTIDIKSKYHEGTEVVIKIPTKSK